MNHTTGAFAEHVIARSHVIFRIPPSLTFEEAASFPAGLITNILALYKLLRLPLPSNPAEKGFPVLVYGGSTATGVLAIQLLKL
jgi:NADPH:quinone reductase-like Zn-dependent oxidoreductase